MKTGMYACVCVHGCTCMYMCRTESSLAQCPRCCLPYPLPWPADRVGYLGNESQECFDLFLPELGLQMHTTCLALFFVFLKHGLWGLNSDPHACKARQTLSWVITPIPKNQTVVRISSADFVSICGCRQEGAKQFSYKKSRNAETEVTKGHPWSRLVIFCLYLASLKTFC